MRYPRIKFKFLLFFLAVFLGEACRVPQTPVNYLHQNRGLKDHYRHYFLIGVAVSLNNLDGEESVLIKRHFNSITAENEMKMSVIQPREGFFNWKAADSIVDYAVRHNLQVRGHTLCWHEQVPDWMFVGADGQEVSELILLKRLKTHIQAIVTRYKGKIQAWDVVNEAIDDDAQKHLRDSPWYRILGEDFIAKAFEYAHEADPSALLFYNDYNADRPDKTENIYRLLKSLLDRGVPIHGMGLQSHWSIHEPKEEALVAAIQRYSSLGLILDFTEVDVSVYPWEKVPRDRRPEEQDVYTLEMAQQQAEKYEMVFRVFRKYRHVIRNVTFWNVSDRHTWLSHYPVKGRKNYPLLFDTLLQPKQAYWKVVNFKDK